MIIKVQCYTYWAWLKTSYNSSTWPSLSVLGGLGESNSKSKISTLLLYPLRLGSILNTLGENWDLLLLSLTKIPHTANTRPYHTRMVQEYQYYTIHKSKSLSIPWVQVYTMSSGLYHESFNTMSPFQYHKSTSVHKWRSTPCVHVYNMSPSLYYESKSVLRGKVQSFEEKTT